VGDDTRSGFKLTLKLCRKLGHNIGNKVEDDAISITQVRFKRIAEAQLNILPGKENPNFAKEPNRRNNFVPYRTYSGNLAFGINQKTRISRTQIIERFSGTESGKIEHRLRCTVRCGNKGHTHPERTNHGHRKNHE
jgi:hypothetical protein